MTPTPKQRAALMAHPMVDDVEWEGLDEGRFFVHLKDGYDWNVDPCQTRVTHSFGSVREARAALAKAKAETR